jgi:CHAT domain-containing protein/tetratricopeptide (TPR) repeat protein
VVEDRREEAETLDSIGEICDQSKDDEKALGYHNQALTHWRELRDRNEEATTLGDIARDYDAIGKKQKALNYYYQALLLWRALNDRHWEAATLHNIGRVYSALGEKQRALDYYDQALPLWRAAHDRSGESNTLSNIGKMYRDLGKKQTALAYLTQALSLSRTSNDTAGEAMALVYIGWVYEDLGKKQKALEYLNQALALWQAANDCDGEADTVDIVGGVYDTFGEKQKALDYYNHALPLWRAAHDRSGEATTLNNIGKVYRDLGEKQKALDYYDQALRLHRAVNDPAGEAGTLNNIGKVYDDLGEEQTALNSYSQALRLWRAVHERSGEAETLDGIGLVYDSFGEKQKALDHYNQALLLAQAIQDRATEAITRNNIGLLYDSLGEKQRALDQYNQALRLAAELQDRAQQAITRNNIGLLYNSLGEQQKALDYYNQALPLERAVQDRASEATTISNVGKVYSALGEKQKALNQYNQALLLERAVQDRSLEATSFTSIGEIYSELGDNPKALDYSNQALCLHRAVGNRNGEAVTLNNIGGVYRELGDEQRALDYYNQALQLERAAESRAYEAATVGNMAVIERNQGKLTEARTSAKDALALFESLRANVGSQELRATYFATVQGYYQLYIDILMRLHAQHPKEGYDALALEASERGRARSLLETLTEAHADIRQGVDPRVLEREQRLQQMLDAESDLRTRLLNGEHTDEQAATVEKEIDRRVSEYQDVEAQIRATSPRYAALTQPQPLSAREIQKQVLDSGTVLLEYSLGEENSYLWVVTQDSVASYTLPKRQEIESVAAQVYKLLQQSNQSARSQRATIVGLETTAQPYSTAASRLSEMLLGPAASQLGGKRLVIVADGVLNYIPFGALPTPRGGKTGRKEPPPLLFEHEIVYLPSASILAVLRQETQGRAPAPKLLAMMADPVFSAEDERVRTKAVTPTGGLANMGLKRANAGQPQEMAAEIAQIQLMRSVRQSMVMRDGGLPRLGYTRGEADGLASLVPRAMRLEEVDFAASKANATSGLLRSYRLVHFATHGSLDSEHPELSGLVLSMVDERGSPVDGFLQLHDIFNLKLPAELVVLSACETGLGREIKGEGLIGLTRGFMYAGAPRVVVSLWSVDDEATAELMKRFYQGMLIRRLSPPAALRAAQMALESDARWKAPYYWGAFVLQGDWKSLSPYSVR